MAKIPFDWLPWTIGMKGKTRERAKAEYYLSGYELEMKLLDLDYDDDLNSDKSKEKQKKSLLIQKKYNKISEMDFDYAMLIQYDENSIDYKVAKVELDHKYGKIKPEDYERELSTAKNEPWVTIKSEYSPGDGLSGLAVELDWNEQFVQQLKDNGYVGVSDDNLVQQWFAEICRQAAEEEGIMDELMEPINQKFESQFAGPRIKQNRMNDKTEYS